MPLNAEDDLALKRFYEGRLERRIRSFASQLALDMRLQLFGSPSPNLVGMGQPILRSILFTHYEDVGSGFDHDLTDAMPDDVAVTPGERAMIAEELDRIFNLAADEQSELMMESAQRIALESIVRADRLIEDDEDLTRHDRPTLASNIFRRRRLGSAGATATTETAWAAERTKAVEASVLVHQDGGEQPKFRGEEIKVWRSQGDSSVRGSDGTGVFNHFDPDGQGAAVDGFFIVSGEMLRWPGDTALGASLGNIMRCRCSAIYTAKDVAALRRLFDEPIHPSPIDLFHEVPNPTTGISLVGEPIATELFPGSEQ